ncbi:MAG: UDP-N-acetylmuramoyl-L-alanine--D-glutamate ligase [Tepidisphaeraceae bacterium]
MPISLNNRRVTVFGLGRFGGGIAVARWLCEQGAVVTVTDRDDETKLADSVRQLAGLPITFRLGEQWESDFTQTDLVVTSPAVKPTHPLLAAAEQAGVPVTTEICLFAERCPGRVFGVTGTKGKSTTSKLLGLMLQSVVPNGLPFVGGNIGKSLLAELPRMTPASIVVLELSSYMLHWLGKMSWSPNVAVLTMLGRDHVDWHGSADAYIDAKRNIVRYQKPGDRIVRRSDALSATFMPNTGVSVDVYPDQALPPFELKLPGEHNQVNAQAAFIAAKSAGVSWVAAQAAVAEFAGLPHRLQLVGERQGVRYFNDSIATIPEAAVLACDAFLAGRVIQIVGGSKKEGLTWDAMCDHLAARCKKVLTIGEIGPALAERCGDAGEFVGTLDAAVSRANQLAIAGDVVLLSPGTASYDQFPNFEKRGERFAELAKA